MKNKNIYETLISDEKQREQINNIRKNKKKKPTKKQNKYKIEITKSRITLKEKTI